MARRSLEDRFWRNVTKGDGCWVWVGPAQGDYGCMMYNRKIQGAHRWAYELLVGEIPKSMVVDHKCGNRMCVNPDHLRLATHSENSRNRMQNKNPTSGRKGCTWVASKGRWVARIKVDGKSMYLGSFVYLEDAREAYRAASDLHHGSFGNHG